MDEKQIYARAYNSAIIVAKNLEIITSEEAEDLLINPKSETSVLEIIANKVKDKEEFKNFIGLHVATYIGNHPKYPLKLPTNESEAIKLYHELLKGYFGKIKIIGNKNINVIMENCPYSKFCEKTGCVRKYAIEAAVEYLIGKEISLNVEKEEIEEGKTVIQKCVLSYYPGYDKTTIDLFKKFEEIEKDIKPLTFEEIIEENSEHFIK